MVRWSMGLLVGLLVLGVGCEVVPKYVEKSHEVDQYLVRSQFQSACVGLKAREDSLREYTARKLAEYPEESIATECVCAALYTEGSGKFDAAVAKGLENTRRGDLVGCLAPALGDGGIEDKKGLVRGVAQIAAPESYAALAGAVRDLKDPEVRALAAAALQPSEEHVPLLLEMLKEDPEASVRAAAAGALIGRDGKEVVEVVSRSAVEDENGEVRAAALTAVVKLKLPETDTMVCKAMLEDPEESVRYAAVKSVHGTRRPEVLACLKKRLLTQEESTLVRGATLKALGASPSDEAATALCSSIGPFLRMYVKEQIAERMEAVNIIETQNNRDWERSYACVQAALSQGGYSCYARNHLAAWFKELGGNAHQPRCPGM